MFYWRGFWGRGVYAVFVLFFGVGYYAGMSIFVTAAQTNQEALDFIRGKIVLGRDVFLGLAPGRRSKAITITGVENLYMIQTIRDLLAGVPSGEDWNATKQNVADLLTPYMGGGEMADSEFFGLTEPGEKARAKAEARAELLLRTHVGQAYAVTYTEALDSHKDVFPYRQYLTMGDSSVRASHAALDNLILPADHPFWTNHTPPWDWNCRCSFAGLTADEAGEIAREEDANGTPEAQRLLPDEETQERLSDQERILRGNQIVDVRTEYEKEGPAGYQFNARTLSTSRRALMEGLDPDLRTDFKEWAQGTIVPELEISLWDWLLK